MEELANVLNNPATRQKSCDACVKSKRRCDKQLPVCSRCMERRYLCIYQKMPEPDPFLLPDKAQERALGAGATSATNSAAVPPFLSDIPLGYEGFFDLTHPDLRPPLAEPQVEEPQVEAAGVETSVTDADSDIDMDSSTGSWPRLGSAFGPPDVWLMGLRPGQTINRPRSPSEIVVDREEIDGGKMQDICKVEPWELYDPNTKVHWLVNHAKSFAEVFARTNALPFLHKHLYRDAAPPCVLRAFTVCTLYANRTEATMGMVMRALQSAVGELGADDGSSSSNSGNGGSGNRTSTSLVVAAGLAALTALNTPQEKLAHTQALLLYLTIRLFDGNVALRAQAERDIDLLAAWLGELCKVRENMSELAQLEDGKRRERPPKSWDWWIFAESVRRTIICGYFVLTMYLILKNEFKTHPETDGWWACIHRWTMSRHLWEAESSFDFNVAWAEKPHYIINNFLFEDFLTSGRGEDVDEFGKFMLISYIGQDHTRQFFAETGAVY